MTYAHGLGKGGGGGHGGGGHGGGHHGGGHHGGGYHGGRGFRRGLWYGGYGPGYINYASYSPCDECWSQPPSFVLPCLRAHGCVVNGPGVLMGMGQAILPPPTMTPMMTRVLELGGIAAAIGVAVGVGTRSIAKGAGATGATVGLGVFGAGALYLMSAPSSRNLMIGGALGVGLVGAGTTWWLKGRRKKRKSS